MNATPERGFAPTLVAIALCLAAAFGAAARLTHGFRAFTSEAGRRLAVAEHPFPVSPLAVVEADGTAHALWSADPGVRAWVVTFVYTRCTSICLSLGSEFQQLQRTMRERPAPGVRLLSLSFDRAHDTPATLAAYERRFHVDPTVWTVGVPASDGALARLLQQAGVVVIDDGLGGYAHNAAIHVVVPPGRVVAIFDMDQYREALAYAARLSS